MAKKSGPALTEGLSSHSHKKFLFLFGTFSSDCGCEALPLLQLRTSLSKMLTVEKIE